MAAARLHDNSYYTTVVP